jgi:hypothetical protein
MKLEQRKRQPAASASSERRSADAPATAMRYWLDVGRLLVVAVRRAAIAALLFMGGTVAGQGDFLNPDAWSNTTPTVGVGIPAVPTPRGDVQDVAASPTDPDRMVGLIAWGATAPTIGVGSILAVVGKGDVGDVYGGFDSRDDPSVSGLSTWAVQASSIGTGSLLAVAPHGQPESPFTWIDTAPTIGVASIAPPVGHGDVTGDYGVPEGGVFEIVTWAPSAPTIGTGIVAPVAGRGDITDPYAWEDAVFYLTSQIYPVLDVEAMMANGALEYAPTYSESEVAKAGGDFIAGSLAFFGTVTYTFWPEEPLKAGGNFIAGSIVLGLTTYTNWPEEPLKAGGNLIAGSIVLGLTTYTNWPEEPLKAGGNFIAGVLT